MESIKHTTGRNIAVFVDNTGVTGTAVKINGTQIFGTVAASLTFPLQPNEYFSETYSAGTPTAKIKPQ